MKLSHDRIRQSLAVAVLSVVGCAGNAAPQAPTANAAVESPRPPEAVAELPAKQDVEKSAASPAAIPAEDDGESTPTFTAIPFEVTPPMPPFADQPQPAQPAVERRLERIPAPLKSAFENTPKLLKEDRGVPAPSTPVLDQPELSRTESPRPNPPAMPGARRLRAASLRPDDPTVFVPHAAAVLEKPLPSAEPEAKYVRAVTVPPASVGREAAVAGTSLTPPDPDENVRTFRIGVPPPETEIPGSATIPRFDFPKPPPPVAPKP